MKKTLYLVLFSWLIPSLAFAAKAEKATEGIYDMGGRKLIDRSVEVTGALQVDKWLELINESTPSTPASTHARFFYNNGQQKLCVVFGDGSQTCLGPGTAGGGGVFSGATAPILYNSTTNVISFSQTVGQNETFTSSVTFTTATLTNSYIDMLGIADPQQPGTGVARLHAITTQGISRLEQDNSTGNTDVILGEDTVYIVRNNSNGTLLPLQVVYVNGATGNIPQVGLALSSSTTYMPAVAVVVDSITNNSYGQVMKLGVLNHVNTNAFNVGDMLYVSATTSGSLTNVAPVYPNYPQVVATVLVKGTGNGSLLVNIPSSFKGQESGTDQFMWTASTITTKAINNSYNLTTGTETVTGYEDFIAQGVNPPSPPAGVARFHSATTQGFTRFEQDNEAPTNLILGRDTVFIAKNTSGANMPAGKAVYITGATGNVPNVSLAIASFTVTGSSKVPAVGLTLDPIANNSFGQIMYTGIIANINTSAFAVGDPLYVSSTSSGELTNVRPSSTSYAQRMGSVLVSSVGNGAILVVTAPFLGNRETGTNQSEWDANSITVSSLTVNGNAGIKGNINQPLTITSSVTLSGVNLLDDNGVIQSSGGFQALNQKSVAFFAPNSANNITLQAPNSVTSYNMQLPSAQGVANSLLQNDGTGALTWASSNTVRGYISATQPIYYNSATGVISENAVSLSTGVVGILPEANTLHTFASSITVNNTFQTNTDSTSILYVSNSVHTLPANTVDIGASGSAAHIVWADQVALGTGTVQISQDFNNGTNTYGVTWPPAQGAAQSLLSNNGNGALSWTNGPTFTSSVTVQSPSGLYTTYGASLGSATLRNVASGTQCIHADASGNLTGTGSDCNAGAGTLASTQTWTGTNTFANAVVITSNSVVTSSTNACGYLIGTQVQTVFSSSTISVGTNSATYAVTNTTVTINPRCITDKIIVSAVGTLQNPNPSNNEAMASLFRDATDLFPGTLLHQGFAVLGNGGLASQVSVPASVNMSDTPNTVSGVAYNVRIKANVGGGNTMTWGAEGVQYILLREIAQ